jgi:D-alanyl-D-alanine carboxypeptidase
MLKAASFVLVAAAAAVPLQAQSTFDARVDSLANRILEQTGVPSASVAVVRDGRLAYAKAYGSERLDPPMAARADQRYSIGSISKQFAASCVLLLQQDGKLSLDDKVSRWLPDLTRASEVTVREILSHTSGYQDYWPQDYVPPMMLQPTTAQEIMDRWAKKPLDFDPGTRWQYSNTNYVIAGVIVEKVSGMPFFDFLRARILAPLGIASAMDIDVSRLTEPQATGYMRYALGPLHPAPKEGAGWLFAMGELSMTASDLAKWDVSLMSESLLQPASYRDLETEVLLKNGLGTGYGLGVSVGSSGGHRVISHSGEVSGFTAQNLVFPDDRAAVVVLTNQDAARAAGALAQAISGLLFTGEDADTQARVAQALQIFEGLQKGTIDRSLFTDDANFYFNEQALKDFSSSLAPLGTPRSFTQTSQSLRGGMLARSFRAVFPGRTLRVWTFQMPDGKLEQYQVASEGGP